MHDFHRGTLINKSMCAIPARRDHSVTSVVSCRSVFAALRETCFRQKPRVFSEESALHLKTALGGASHLRKTTGFPDPIALKNTKRTAKAKPHYHRGKDDKKDKKIPAPTSVIHWLIPSRQSRMIFHHA
jgi:hypothetical protein